MDGISFPRELLHLGVKLVWGKQTTASPSPVYIWSVAEEHSNHLLCSVASITSHLSTNLRLYPQLFSKSSSPGHSHPNETKQLKLHILLPFSRTTAEDVAGRVTQASTAPDGFLPVKCSLPALSPFPLLTVLTPSPAPRMGP